MKIVIETDNCKICSLIVEEIQKAKTDEEKYWKAEELTDHWNQQSSIMHQIVNCVMEKQHVSS